MRSLLLFAVLFLMGCTMSDRKNEVSDFRMPTKRIIIGEGHEAIAQMSYNRRWSMCGMVNPCPVTPGLFEGWSNTQLVDGDSAVRSMGPLGDYVFVGGGVQGKYYVSGLDPATGKKLWTQTKYNGSYPDEGQTNTLAFLPSSLILYTAGYKIAYDPSYNPTYYGVVNRMTTKGDEIWLQEPPILQTTEYFDSCADISGFYIAGKLGVGASFQEAYVVKYSPDGTIKWEFTNNDKLYNSATRIVKYKGALYALTNHGWYTGMDWHSFTRIYKLDPDTGAATILLETAVDSDNVISFGVGGGYLYYATSTNIYQIVPQPDGSLKNGWTISANVTQMNADDTGVYVSYAIPEEDIIISGVFQYANLKGFTLTKFALSDGVQKWTTPYDKYTGIWKGVWITGYPALNSAGVYIVGRRENGGGGHPPPSGVATYNACAFMFDKTTGRLRWEYFLEDSYGSTGFSAITAGQGQ